MRRPGSVPARTGAIDWRLYDLAKGLKNIERKYGPEVEPSPYEYGAAGLPEQREADDQSKPAPHHHIERYVAFPLGEQLRQRVEEALQEHGIQDEEVFYAFLLNLGLRTLQDEPDAFDPRKVKADLRSPLSAKAAARWKFRREWETLCENVRRGWR